MRSGFVAVAGRPNVGKSTLVNALTGEKVAIVSRVPHTTRHRIHGIHKTDDAQLVLVDLPGWQRPIDPLTQRMWGRVEETMADDLDAVLLVANARERIGAGDRFVARHVFALGVPVVIALNKVDRLKASHIASQMKEAATLGDFHALHPVSAKTGDGIGELRADLVSLLPEGPLYYPPGEVTDMPLEARIAELVREQALRLTLTTPAARTQSDELPMWSADGRSIVFVRTGPTNRSAAARGSLYLMRPFGGNLIGPIAAVGTTGNYYGHYGWYWQLDWYRTR